MKPPVRWLASKDAPPGAAELLSAARLPPPFTDAVRYRLGIAVGHTAASVTTATSAWSALLAKGAFIAAIGGGSGYLAHSLASTEPASVVAPPVAQASPLPRLDLRPLAPVMPAAPVDPLPALELPTAPTVAPKLRLDPRLQEAELLEKARSLVGASPSAALKLTAEHARQFPKGRLGAEADLLAAQALLGLGDLAGAKARAQSSLRRYPNGIYARQLREIVAR